MPVVRWISGNTVNVATLDRCDATVSFLHRFRAVARMAQRLQVGSVIVSGITVGMIDVGRWHRDTAQHAVTAQRFVMQYIEPQVIPTARR